MRLSLLYVTNRPGGLDILKDNLDRQTLQDFQLVIVDDLYDWRHKDVYKYFKEYRPIYIKPREKEEGDVWNLNKAYNDGIKRCETNLIVSLQDYIWISANGLQRFYDTFKEHKALITGVGNKALLPNKLDYKGQISCFNELPKLVGISETDHRIAGDKELVESDYSRYELNWACFPNGLKFDEEMDKTYGGDNTIFALKAVIAGYKIYIDRKNECLGYNQSLFGRPKDWEEKHGNKGQINKRIWEITNQLQ